jgi:hypothetical protein
MKKILPVISLILALSGCASGREVTAYYRWMGDPAQNSQERLEADNAQCRWQVRQASMGRPYPPQQGYGGYNDPQMGAGMAGLTAAIMATPGPGLMDECLAARGWRLEGRGGPFYDSAEDRPRK